MNKCGDCPIDDSRHWGGETQPWCNWLGDHTDDCHLTTDDFPIIRAMIAGEYDCGHCVKMIDFVTSIEPCPVRLDDPKAFPCEGWEPKLSID